MNLKYKKIQEAKKKLKKLENELRILLISKNDPQKIIDCKHAIQKQRTIIKNIKNY